MKLAYKAFDKSGTALIDSIEAASPEEAGEKLRQQGLYVTNISESDGEEVVAAPSGTVRSRRGRYIKDLAIWSRQLYVLVHSGTPLASALVAIERQTSPGARRDVLTDLQGRVQEGESLSDAMARHPSVFDDVSRSMIAAGESSGQLGPILDRLARLLRQQLKIRRALLGAMVYPILLSFVGVAVTLIMLIGVIPRFSELFETLSAPLPPTTDLLMTVSTLFRSHWLPMLLAVVGVVVAIKLAMSGPTGRRLMAGWVLALPQFGKMARSIATARIARLLGVMLDSRVPMLDALNLTRTATGNVHYNELMSRTAAAAARGESLSSVFSESPLITPSVAEAVRHGEQNGQVGPVLLDMADFLDEENEVIVKTAMSIVEPLILVFLGVVVGFIALSLFIPLFDLTAATGTG